MTHIWPAGEIPRTTFAVAVVTGGIVVLTTTLETGITPMPPLNVTREFSRIPSARVDRGARTKNKSPRPDMNFMTHSSEEAFRLQLHRELRLASGLRSIRFSHDHKMKLD